MSSFRFAGLRKPNSKPRVRVIKTPLWEPNRFVGGVVSPDNDPIYSVSGNPPYPAGSAVTLKTPAVTESVFHYRLPGTAYMSQPSDSAMAWGIDKCFAFKCYLELDSVTGRIPIFSRRDSIDSGGPFIEVRDGHVVCGWYDTKLKKEVYVSTSKPVIEPGFVYYLYYCKWYPRGGHTYTTGGPLYYGGGNWLNSVHYGNFGVAADQNATYDSLVVRRFPRVSNSTGDFYTWCGYDAKSHQKVGNPTKAYYNFYTNKSSNRACVSFVAADSSYTAGTPLYGGPAESRTTPSGCVLYKLTLDKATTTSNIVAIASSTTPRFVLDHVGMLLQIEDSNSPAPFGSEVFRIVEFISATQVRVIKEDSTSPSFSFTTGNQYVSIFPDVSLVKSPDYDASVTPDKADYAIEVFGSSLAGDPLSGISQFNGRAWSFAWGMFSTAVTDSGSYKVGKLHVFEDFSQSLAARQRATCGCEAGTDVFGLQGSTNPEDGSLPLQGVPAGELHAETGGFARVAVDTVSVTTAFPWTSTATFSTAPSSTQPNATNTIALDAASTSTAPLVIGYTREVAPGTRRMRLSFYDPDSDEEGEPGDEVSFKIQIEDNNNPSGRVDLVLENLPVSTEQDRTVWRRVRMSLDGSSTYYIAKDIEDSSSYSASVPIDDVSMQALSDPITAATLLSTYGAPPRASYITFSAGRLVAGKLRSSPNSVAYSKAGVYSSFPVANVLPVAAGESDITGLVSMRDAFVVMKRGAIVAYSFSDDIVLMQRVVVGDGCTSNASIASLEDRVYYMSDRGPMVLLSDYTPFFVGWRIQNLMKTFDHASLEMCAAGINRQRGQIVMTARKIGDDRMSARIGLEFQHPMKGEDTIRAELIAGHRYSYYEEPAASSFATLYRSGDSQFQLVAGTEEGFAVWMDSPYTQLSMRGTKLENNLGSIGSGALQSRWSTKDMDLELNEIDKLVHYLDASRPEGLTGTMTVEVYRNRAAAPIGSFSIDLSQPFSSEELALHIQEARSIRLMFRLPSNHSGTIWELLDLTLRHQIVDSK